MNSRLKNPIVKIKQAAQTVNNSTTYVNDDTLVVNNLTVGAYYYFLHIDYTTEPAADIKFKLAATNCTAYRQDNQIKESESTAKDPETESIQTPASTAIRQIHWNGRIVVTTSPATFQIQWAQNTADVSNTSLTQGSTLIIYRNS